MNKEVSPVVAFIIIALILCPLVFWGWAAGERALQVAGTLYLETTSENKLSIQADHLVVIQDELGVDSDILDLGRLGVDNPQGNVSYFNDGHLLVRAGKSAYGIIDYVTMQEAQDSEFEARQQELGELKEADQILLKCTMDLDQCKSLGSIKAPWRHRLFIDPKYQYVHVVDGLGHEVRSYNQYGMLLSSFKSGLRFPKRIRCYRDSCYLVDTNNRRLVSLSQNEAGGFMVNGELVFEKLGDDFNWIIDAYQVDGNWWVISADNSMRTSKVNIFDQKGRFKQRLKLEDDAEPFDILLKDNEVLISDIASGEIFRFDPRGEQLGKVNSAKVQEYFSKLITEREKYDQYVFFSKLFLALLGIIGTGLLLHFGRKSKAS